MGSLCGPGPVSHLLLAPELRPKAVAQSQSMAIKGQKQKFPLCNLLISWGIVDFFLVLMYFPSRNLLPTIPTAIGLVQKPLYLQ